ncbi:hypothetical protein BXP70_28980 [Hymenobacter crusticola]|uniref:SMODS and SLOG-associating 2TM effector domain-containing protein n=2 Tax=Hymenobacter crusticola TaxID=1770526 RepID=A0A243W553_9BACT|nr:hypothetical protein BXP70_28980 [Hymenobacter crusticola]
MAPDLVYQGPKAIIQFKMKEYHRSGMIYQIIYYSTRLLAALAAGLLPFLVGKPENVLWSQTLSIVIVIVTVVDSVFNPREKWIMYSNASDALSEATLKQDPDYIANQEAIKKILDTESAKLNHTVTLEEVVDKVGDKLKDK